MSERGAAAAEMVGELARVIGALSDAFREQAEFHYGGGTAFGVQNLREARIMADRRVGSAGFAGPRLLREIAKTLLQEVARGALLAQRALAEAGSEAWPDLAAAVEDAKTILAATAEADAGLLHPAGVVLPPPGTALPAAPDALPAGWVVLPDGGYARTDAAVPLSVGSMPAPGGGTAWTARFGSVTVAMTPTPEAAAKAAESALEAVFGAPDRAPRPR